MLQRPMESELLSYCQSELLSEEGLRKLIARHRLTPHDNHNLLSDYKFFHAACKNERVTEGIIQCLLEYFPDAASAIDEDDEDGCLPLHTLCDNKNVTLNISQLITSAHPASVRGEDMEGNLPLHAICHNEEVDETIAIEILKFLIDKYPEAVRHADNDGFLPIHLASMWFSPEFCRVLIEAYPGSERMTTNKRLLPLHLACLHGSLATVEYLHGLSTDSIAQAANWGWYPIHFTIRGMRGRRMRGRGDPGAAMEIVQFLLDRDPNVKLQKYGGMSLVHFVCAMEYNDSNIEVGIQMIQIIYNAHPESIEDNGIMSGMEEYHQEVQVFVHTQLGHARKAKVHRLMTTPDMNGQLPLHTALRNYSACFGSIKLLVKGNPAAVQSVDNRGRLPLHIACMHYDTVSVIQYLVELDQSTLVAADRNGNTALHLACRGARYETIALLLDEFDAMSVSKRNVDEKLPIDLLFESDEVLKRESVDYTESVYRLLRANPETIMSTISQAQAQFPLAACHETEGKKRKFDHD